MEVGTLTLTELVGKGEQGGGVLLLLNSVAIAVGKDGLLEAMVLS